MSTENVTMNKVRRSMRFPLRLSQPDFTPRWHDARGTPCKAGGKYKCLYDTTAPQYNINNLHDSIIKIIHEKKNPYKYIQRIGTSLSHILPQSPPFFFLQVTER